MVSQHSWLALLNAFGSIVLGVIAAALGWWAGSKCA
jgi:fluoride ion exporter CrcB/FEX